MKNIVKLLALVYKYGDTYSLSELNLFYYKYEGTENNSQVSSEEDSVLKLNNADVGLLNQPYLKKHSFFLVKLHIFSYNFPIVFL